MMFAKAIISLCLPLLTVGLAEDSTRELIPPSFPSQDPSNYTIRYLSQLGSDEEACLSSQNSSSIQYCRTIRYALTGQSSGVRSYDIHNLIMLVSPGTYFYNMTIEIYNSSSIVIAKDPELQGEAVFSCIEYSSSFNNIYFQDVEGIALWGLTVSRCGPRSSGMTMSILTNLRVYNCTFRDNIHAGFIVNRGTDIVIENSSFINNTADSSYLFLSSFSHNFRVGGGLTISYENSVGHDLAHAIVRNCTFVDNRASINPVNSEDAARRPNLYVPRGHGGALHVAFQNTTGHLVFVDNCSFTNNSAELTGGAVSVLFYRGAASTGVVQASSRNNMVRIENSVFRENNCSRNGGAVSANTFEAANSSKVFVRNNLFERNGAKDEGGAFSFIIEDNIVINSTGQISNFPIVENSTFVNNWSPQGGSAISLVSNARAEQAVDAAWITGCHFVDNQANLHSALLSLRYPITLAGHNLFARNVGGAVTLLQTRLDIFGSVLLQDNMADEGSGIKLVDDSRLNLFEGANVTFVGNHANYQGGAMKVVSSSLIDDINDYYRFYNSCFFTYKSRQSLTSDANATVLFSNNSAGKDGAAIYATSLVICTRNSPYLKADELILQTANYYNNSLFVEHPFKFRDNTVMRGPRVEDSIATEPSYFTVTPLNMSGAPGQIIHLNIRARGQSGNPQDTLWSANFKQTRFFSLNENGTDYHPVVEYPEGQRSPEEVCTQPYEAGVELGVLGTTSLDFSIIQTLSGTVVNTTSVALNITCCNPGYIFQNTTEPTCIQDPNLANVILRSDADNKYFYIPLQIYAQWRNGSLLWATIPVIFTSCVRSPRASLPGCLFKYNAPQEQCRDNRTGFLCGKCADGQAVDLTLSRCIQCEAYHSFLIAAIVVAFAVVCALVMVFNIRVPNEMRGFLFYIQVVGFVYNNLLETERLAWDYYLSSVFGFSLFIPLCAYPGYDALYMAAFQVILPATAIITIILYVISARFIKHLSNKNSFEGIWFLTFIIYKFIADACFGVLRCQKVNNGRPNEYVYYYDGEVQCFSTEFPNHLAFAIVAIFFSALIILFPLFILIISFKRFKLTVNITDVLNKDLKHSCRWWASFDLFRRLLFIFIVLFSSYVWPLYNQLSLFYAGVLVFVVFAFAQPYTSKKANISEGLVLADLLIVSAIFLSRNVTDHEKIMPLALLLLLLPFLYILIYFVFKIMAFLWNKFSPTNFKTACSALMCKLMRKVGIKLPFLPSVECVSHRPPVITDLPLQSNDTADQDALVDGNFAPTQYIQYREELLDD